MSRITTVSAFLLFITVSLTLGVSGCGRAPTFEATEELARIAEHLIDRDEKFKNISCDVIAVRESEMSERYRELAGRPDGAEASEAAHSPSEAAHSFRSDGDRFLRESHQDNELASGGVARMERAQYGDGSVVLELSWYPDHPEVQRSGSRITTSEFGRTPLDFGFRIHGDRLSTIAARPDLRITSIESDDRLGKIYELSFEKDKKLTRFRVAEAYDFMPYMVSRVWMIGKSELLEMVQVTEFEQIDGLWVGTAGQYVVKNMAGQHVLVTETERLKFTELRINSGDFTPIEFAFPEGTKVKDQKTSEVLNVSASGEMTHYAWTPGNVSGRGWMVICLVALGFTALVVAGSKRLRQRLSQRQL
jgi:hypothetical protein